MRFIYLANLRLNTRLVLGFAIPAIILIGVAAEVGYATSRVARQAEHARLAGKESFAAAIDAQRLKYHTVQVQQFLTDISATRGQDGSDDGFTKAEEHAKSFAKILQQFEKAAAQNPKELQQLDTISTAFAAYYKEAILMAQAYIAEGPPGGNKLMGTVDKQAEALVSAVDPFVEQHSLEGQEVLIDLAASVGRVRSIVWWSAAAAAALAVGTGLLMGRSIARPIQRVISQFRVTAKGDLTVNVPSDLLGRKDEIGEFAGSVQSFIEMLRSMLGEVSQSVITVAASSTEMSAISNQTAAGVRATSEKTSAVASAAEEMSSNSSSVAAGMEQATSNLNSVASAAEEMTSTIGEIATHSEKARVITSEATQHAQNIAGRIAELSKAASEIGKVNETITTISDQTKLLALNATIEAARAGVAGKGFAVVAHEIKELARQTAEATEDIKSKINRIQTSTTITAQDFKSITQVIGQVGEIVNAIASAIEEQSSVTKDIARNVTEAATGVQDANQRVAQISSASQSVAKDISALNEASGDITSGSEQVLTSAAELSKLAKDLHVQVSRFRIDGANSSSARETSPKTPQRDFPIDSSRGRNGVECPQENWMV